MLLEQQNINYNWIYDNLDKIYDYTYYDFVHTFAIFIHVNSNMNDFGHFRGVDKITAQQCLNLLNSIDNTFKFNPIS